MAEEIHVIAAGSRPAYEVVVSEDRLSVTIREAEDHDHHIQIISSVLSTLIRTLQEIKI